MKLVQKRLRSLSDFHHSVSSAMGTKSYFENTHKPGKRKPRPKNTSKARAESGFQYWYRDTKAMPDTRVRTVGAFGAKNTVLEWTESELDKFVVGSRDLLSEHFPFLRLKIDPPITEIFLLCWENSCLIKCVSKTQGLFLSCLDGILIQQKFSQHNKCISVMGGSILSGKNAKCSER
eukprot:sb/3471854/